MPMPWNPTPLAGDERERAGRPESLRLALAVARPWVRRFPGLADEVRSAALWGLVAAARGFRDGRGAKWETYLALVVRGRVLDELRSAGLKGFRRRLRPAGRAVPRLVGLSTPVRAPSGEPQTLGDTLPADDLPVGWEAESADEVLGLTRRLSRDQRDALRLYLLGADTARLAEVGRRLGLSESRASQLIGAALASLRETMTRENRLCGT